MYRRWVMGGLTRGEGGRVVRDGLRQQVKLCYLDLVGDMKGVLSPPLVLDHVLGVGDWRQDELFRIFVILF